MFWRKKPKPALQGAELSSAKNLVRLIAIQRTGGKAMSASDALATAVVCAAFAQDKFDELDRYETEESRNSPEYQRHTAAIFAVTASIAAIMLEISTGQRWRETAVGAIQIRFGFNTPAYARLNERLESLIEDFRRTDEEAWVGRGMDFTRWLVAQEDALADRLR